MKRPYIVCHMIQSVDGRIDCDMVDKISGDEYYEALEELAAPTILEGAMTMRIHNALPEPFVAADDTALQSEETYFRACEAPDGYCVSVETCGKMQWKDSTLDGQPLVCIVGTGTSVAYLDYLKQKGISYIVVKAEPRVDVSRAMEVLCEQFGVERMTLCGGGTMNGAFLKAGLIDEVSVQIAAGIDGRKGRMCSFDGFPDVDTLPQSLTLTSVKQQGPTVWLRYTLGK